ncbi:hypothetical protein [Lentzea albida]|uniref:Uncharacterized protein n=1 Tax=Lentzea albida TaxID=65499 RepID=A0A1H9TLE1_9PSEU|nr:hypothetical protein [Lentzea albida]SER98120.1 hypothetical protein SAMN04488000_11472 [Lentzea albida]
MGTPDAEDFVPAPGESVVAVWRDDRCVHVVRLGLDEDLLVGRGTDLGDDRVSARSRVLRIPSDQSFISRKHLVVRNGVSAASLFVLAEVRNPGKTRHWGELTWRSVGAGSRVEPRHGLLAFRLPDRPAWVLTVHSGDRRAGRGPLAGPDDEITELEGAPPPIVVSPTQREALVVPLIDAVRWPPSAEPGRVRAWSEVPGGASHRVAYHRLAAAADANAAFPWSDIGRRGADPELLEDLVVTGSISYADVRRLRPWRLSAPEGLVSAVQHEN